MRESTKIVIDRITSALLKLMNQMPLEDISICEIVSCAGVSRNSFYRHFQCKDDILRYYINDETDRWLANTETNYLTAGTRKEYIIFLLEHMYEYRDVVDMLNRDNKMYLLEEEFDKRFHTRLADISDPWRIAFTVGGFYKLFCYWAKTGYEKTPQEIAEYVK